MSYRESHSVLQHTTPRQLSQLIDIIPTSLAWLRDIQPKGGDLFLQGTSNTVTVEMIMLEILEDMNLYGDLSLSKLRSVLCRYPAEIVSGMIRLVIVECQPQFLDANVVDNLLEAWINLLSNGKGVDKASALGPFLDELPSKRYCAFAELCAFLRDCSSHPSEVAALVGPTLFPTAPGTKALAASSIMELLIEDCEIIFGRCASSSKRAALGTRVHGYYAPVENYSANSGNRNAKNMHSRQRTNQSDRHASRRRQALALDRQAWGRSPKQRSTENDNNSQNQRYSSRDVAQSVDSSYTEYTEYGEDVVTTARVQQLVTFYNWRDPPKADRVHLLFQCHDFVHIAKAIHEKYLGAMPPSWKSELADMAAQGIPDLEWITGHKKKGNRLSKRISKPKVTRSALDRIVDEIIDTEHTYYDSLDFLVRFSENVRSIALGRNGNTAKGSLGLSLGDVDKIFGFRLVDIVNRSKMFLQSLEVIDLVRTAPKHEGGRTAFAANAMFHLLDQMNVYRPYICSQKEALDVLSERTKQLSKRRSVRLVPGDNTKKAKSDRQSFLDLWRNSVQSNSVLRGQRLPSVLIMPVQRVPRYELLFKQLLKHLPEHHCARELVVEVIRRIEIVAMDMNRTD
mmetsp:Transcript_20508/g.33874  ORF Transcript_20508/g.33874 Transcript_20508/m.33874 type:complete len:625 (+) Transcript_20508:2977-4851(+)